MAQLGVVLLMFIIIIICAFIDYQKQIRQKAEGKFTLQCVILSIFHNNKKDKADLKIISKISRN